MPVVINPSLGVSFPDGTTQASASEGKNLLINGNFMVDQWNSGASISTLSNADSFGCDRWFIRTFGTSISSQRIGTQGSYALQLTGVAGNTGICVGQRIESYNIAHLVGKTLTFSFVASSSSLTSATVVASTPADFDNGYSFPTTGQQTITLTPTPQRISVQIVVPSGANKGLQVFIRLASLTAGTFTISDAQLEVGSTFSVLQRPTIQQALASCQRYFWSVPQPSFDVMNKRYAPGAGSFQPVGDYKFPVTMRIAPTENSSNIVYTNCSTLVLSGKTQDFASWTVTTSTATMYSVRFAATYNSEIY